MSEVSLANYPCYFVFMQNFGLFLAFYVMLLRRVRHGLREKGKRIFCLAASGRISHISKLPPYAHKIIAVAQMVFVDG